MVPVPRGRPFCLSCRVFPAVQEALEQKGITRHCSKSAPSSGAEVNTDMTKVARIDLGAERERGKQTNWNMREFKGEDLYGYEAISSKRSLNGLLQTKSMCRFPN